MHSKIIIALVLININSILYLDVLTNPLFLGGLGSFYPPPLNLGDQKKRKRYNILMFQSQTVFHSGSNLRKKVPQSLSWSFFLRVASSQDSFWHLFGWDLCQSEKLSEIRPPLALPRIKILTEALFYTRHSLKSRYIIIYRCKSASFTSYALHTTKK